MGALRGRVRLAGRELERHAESADLAADLPCRARSLVAKMVDDLVTGLVEPALGIRHAGLVSILSTWRRAGPTSFRVAEACISRTVSGVASHSVRRIAW